MSTSGCSLVPQPLCALVFWTSAQESTGSGLAASSPSLSSSPAVNLNILDINGIKVGRGGWVEGGHGCLG